DRKGQRENLHAELVGIHPVLVLGLDEAQLEKQQHPTQPNADRRQQAVDSDVGAALDARRQAEDESVDLQLRLGCSGVSAGGAASLDAPVRPVKPAFTVRVTLSLASSSFCTLAPIFISLTSVAESIFCTSISQPVMSSIR